MKVAVEHVFTGEVTGSYDPNKTYLGSFIKQTNGYVSPAPLLAINQVEVAGGSYFMPHAHQISATKFWVFVASNATAAATRNIGLYEYDSTENTMIWKGFVTLNGTTFAGNKTIRGLRALVTKHTSGTVGVSSTTVTGDSTAFQTDRIAVGARIGFGSTDPNQITEWYDITAITSDTQLTISGATSVPAGTPYVIEEIRIILAITNATLTNGGVFLIKGLNYSTFSLGGTTIPEATTVDNVRASYFLKDAATSTITVAMGLASDDLVSATQHDVYALNLDSATLVRIHKFNIRAALTVSGGASIDAWVFKTGTSTITGTASQINNGRIFAVNHGAAAGDKSIWFATTTRLYRTSVSSVVDGASNIISDFMTEIPPGTTSTYAITNSMNQVDYSSAIDRLIIPTGALRFGTYIGMYDNILPLDKMAGGLLNRVKLSTTPSDVPDGFFPAAVVTLWTEGGYMFAAPSIVTTGLNLLYVIPIAADAQYADQTNQFVITPKLTTTNALRYHRVYIQDMSVYGSNETGLLPETYNVYYRTTGIDDNTGSWTVLPMGGNISSVSAADYIQFKIEFEVLGEVCIPNRIYSIACVYEDSSQDSHYDPSVSKSNATTNTFAWRQVASWGSSIPDLEVVIKNASTNNVELTDTVLLSASGVWEYSTDGNVWSSWNASADTVGNYIRYVATSLPSNITARVILRQV